MKRTVSKASTPFSHGSCAPSSPVDVMTGTPMQNSLKNLFAEFCMPRDYADLASFLHKDETQAEGGEEKSKKAVEPP
jgi:hypothetical protein